MIGKILLAGFVTSIIWFIAGALLYMNPVAKNIQDSVKNSPALKKWASPTQMMAYVYLLGCLIPSVLIAFVYNAINTVLPSSYWMNVLMFGLILICIKIIPRFSDMATMTSYPKKMLILDIINGSLNSFVMAMVFAYML